MCKPLPALLLSLVFATSVAADPTVRVVDETGAPVEAFEAMWHTAEQGYSNWSKHRDGVWKDFFASPRNEISVLDLIVRAEGFASRFQRFEGDALKSIYESNATIVLKRGKPVAIDLRQLPSPVPNDFVFESFFPDFTSRVHTMWQPGNQRGKKPDWNMLNVKQVDDARFSVRVADDTGEFFLAFQHPGWLRFCEFGPFTADEALQDGITLPVPAPAKIHVTFDPRNSEQDRPFEKANCTIFWVPDESGSIVSVMDWEVPVGESSPVTVADLGPGKYIVDLRTVPRKTAAGDKSKSFDPTEINPGRFFDRETVTLASAQSADVPFAWSPFNPQAHRGTVRAEIKVLRGDGTIPDGRDIKVSWFDGHYGELTVFHGPLPASGIVRLDGVSAARHRSPAPFGPFTLSVDGERVGFFHLEENRDLQQLEFSLIPKPGDPAPDIELTSVDSGERRRLSDYRGQIVVVEFWSTGCGPCRPAMDKLADLAAHIPESWQGKVSLLSVSTDREPRKLRPFLAARGWTTLPHFLGARKPDAYFSDAELTYSIHAIPQALLIDAKGILRWRGHPIVPTDGKTVVDRVNELLE